MLFRFVALAFLSSRLTALRAQQRSAAGRFAQVLKPSQSAEAAPDSAWLDLRQNNPAHSKVQAAPAWVESVTFAPGKARRTDPRKSVFRIRLTRPNEDCQILLFRLYFDDKPEQQPELIAWDESGTQLLRSGPLGQKTGLATSSTTIVPMIGVTAIDVEVPGDGRSVRGAYLDWMKSSQVMRPMHEEPQTSIPAPFAAAPAQGRRGRCRGFRNRDRAAHGRDDCDRIEPAEWRRLSVRARSATARRAPDFRSGEPAGSRCRRRFT